MDLGAQWVGLGKKKKRKKKGKKKKKTKERAYKKGGEQKKEEKKKREEKGGCSNLVDIYCSLYNSSSVFYLVEGITKRI
ncbi:hypothetical protein llap_17290 [Limosa lapponica baueri]|uniref:Uncharacterized protein n=1 Tax=Limosa lapponica baueri TaxID=1758121 RepID=A0A2I0TF39_LIMLA|nr:hypothetical protein llap_17290 [Limosa lapponica baueri]